MRAEPSIKKKKKKKATVVVRANIVTHAHTALLECY